MTVSGMALCAAFTIYNIVPISPGFEEVSQDIILLEVLIKLKPRSSARIHFVFSGELIIYDGVFAIDDAFSYSLECPGRLIIRSDKSIGQPAVS